MTRLHAMTDADFAWLLGERTRADGLMLAERGIAPAEVLAMLRDLAVRLGREVAGPSAWMVVEDGMVVGMISITKRAPDGTCEIGYGTAPAFHGRGVMSRGIKALLPLLAGEGHRRLTVETGVDNPASQRVLERNGFVRTGERHDPEDGALFCWAIDLTDEKTS